MRIANMVEQTKPVQAFPPDDNSATTTLYNGAASGSAVGIDTKEFDEALVMLDLNSISSTGTLTITVNDSSIGTTDVGSSAITDASFGALTVASAAGIYLGNIKTKNTKRYLYVKAVPTVATSKKFSVSVLLGKADVEPVTQDITTVFDV